MGHRRNDPLFYRISLLALVVLAACGEPEPIQNLNGGRIDVIGHGGAGLRSRSNPLVGNSLTSIRKALDGYGADGVEVDLQMTADGVVVLFHDETLERDTNCRGVIAKLPYRKLRKCYLQHAYNFGRGRETIATFDEALALLAKRKPKPSLYLDVKAFTGGAVPGTFDRNFAVAIAAAIDRHDAYRFTFLQSGRMGFLLAATEIFGKRLRILFDAESFTHALVITESLDLDGFVINQLAVNREHVQEAHRRGLWVVLYNVQSAVSARHVADSWPDAVQADSVRVMQQMLAK